MTVTIAMDSDNLGGPIDGHRYETLIRTHRELDDRIGRETARPAVNSFALQALKRRKLRIKDAIAAMERSSAGGLGRTGKSAWVMPHR